MGATTENPSFELNQALLSRLRVLVLEPLSPQDLEAILQDTLTQDSLMRSYQGRINQGVLPLIAGLCVGDARSALNLLEQAVLTLPPDAPLTEAHVRHVLQRANLPYDRASEEHYNCISALHKSLRNSDADAALYWLGRMLEGGEDPTYLTRRLIRFASEDIGNAQPQALTLAIATQAAVETLGLPECKVSLAQLVIFLAACPKSNSAYTAYQAVEACIKAGHVYPVPLALRNAPTSLMKALSYGDGYRYAHDDPRGVSDLDCLPRELLGKRFYEPTRVGYEAALADRLTEFQRRKRSSV